MITGAVNMCVAVLLTQFSARQACNKLMHAVVRGAINQPEAIKEHRAGKVWDQKARKWVDKPTGAMVVDDPQFAEARRRHFGRDNPNASSSETAFPHYYELLGVEVSFAYSSHRWTCDTLAHLHQSNVICALCNNTACSAENGKQSTWLSAHTRMPWLFLQAHCRQSAPASNIALSVAPVGFVQTTASAADIKKAY